MANYTGIILSGGQSRRMGTDKGLYPFNDKPLISYPIHLLSKFCTETIISCNTAEYDRFHIKIVKDQIPNIGPLGGIYSCMMQSANLMNIILPCDMPLISTELIELLLSANTDSPIIVPSVQQRPIPVCGIYSKKILPFIENQILQNNYKLQDLLHACQATVIEIDSKEIIASLVNLNSQDDVRNADHKTGLCK